MAISLETVIVRNDKLLTSEMDDDLVMLSVENGQYYGMNFVGKCIWKHASQPVSVKNLCEKLATEFEVSQEQCEQDVLTFLGQLENKNLVFVV